MANKTGKYYTKDDLGRDVLIDAVNSSAGAADADKVIKTNSSGKVDETLLPQATVSTSSGAGDAGKWIETNSSGLLDETFLPTGVGPEIFTAPASEDLAAGDFVNFWNDSGTLKARKADGSADKPWHGFVKAAVTTGSNATVYLPGQQNDQLSSLTVGAEYFLSQTVAGDVVLAAALDFDTSGYIIDRVGIAASATVILTEKSPRVVIA
jgi:hypothetical protein